MRHHPTLIDYYLTEDGKVFSGKTQRYLTPNDNGLGYLRVKVSGKLRYIHRLVCETYHPNPCNLLEVNHKDGDKSNNSASNLEWCTRSYNNQHALSTGLRVNKGRVPFKKYLVDYQGDQFITEDLKQTCKELGLKYGSVLMAWNKEYKTTRLPLRVVDEL